MSGFIFEKLPYILMAATIVLFAIRGPVRRKAAQEGKKRGKHMISGLCAGMCLGMAIGISRNVEYIALTVSAGMFLGSIVGMFLPEKE